MRSCDWELTEQLAAVFSPLAKATKVTYGELHFSSFLEMCKQFLLSQCDDVTRYSLTSL